MNAGTRRLRLRQLNTCAIIGRQSTASRPGRDTESVRRWRRSWTLDSSRSGDRHRWNRATGSSEKNQTHGAGRLLRARPTSPAHVGERDDALEPPLAGCTVDTEPIRTSREPCAGPITTQRRNTGRDQNTTRSCPILKAGDLMAPVVQSRRSTGRLGKRLHGVIPAPVCYTRRHTHRHTGARTHTHTHTHTRWHTHTLIHTRRHAQWQRRSAERAHLLSFPGFSTSVRRPKCPATPPIDGFRRHTHDGPNQHRRRRRFRRKNDVDWSRCCATGARSKRPDVTPSRDSSLVQWKNFSSEIRCPVSFKRRVFLFFGGTESVLESFEESCAFFRSLTLTQRERERERERERRASSPLSPEPFQRYVSREKKKNKEKKDEKKQHYLAVEQNRKLRVGVN